jgi:hypothetical protein
MKSSLNYDSHDRGRTGFLASASLAAALLLAASMAQADNILVNTNFDGGSGSTAPPPGWTYFDAPTVPASTHDYWSAPPPAGGSATPLSGTEYWKEWGAGYFPTVNNVAGIYEEFGSAPGSVFQASGWFYSASSDGGGLGSPTYNSYVWIDISFLDVHSNLLALYTSADYSESVGLDNWFQYQVTNQCDITSPVATGDPYFTNYTVTGAVTNLIAPSNTTTVRFRFAYLQYEGEGGSCYFDDPALNLSFGAYPPVISNIFPQNMIFVAPSNGFSFDASSPSGLTIDNDAIHLVLNGVDVSSNLAISGSSSNKTVSYQGLQSNMNYNASISVMDVSNLSASASTYFQTTWVGIPPILYLWEAEDFDFNSGMFYEDPALCNAADNPDCYYGTVGTPGEDEQNIDTSVSHLYRPEDAMNIDDSGDYFRENLFLADRTDYEINPFDMGDWVNYTRDFTNGIYWMIARVATGINGTLTLVNVANFETPLGTFTVTNGLGWTTFQNVFLLDANGNKVNLTLNGKTTLQVQSTAGNLLPNFFALVVATPDEPILSGLYPTGAQPFEYTNTLSFTVNTLGATFPADGIQVILDGSNVTSSLVITGPSSNETVVYPSLVLNAMHTAIVSVTNSLGHGFLITNQFDTFYPNNYMVQASDFDFSGGHYIPIDVNNYNSPDWYPNAYDGLEATTNIDFQHTTISGEQYPYRPDGIPQEQGHDYLTTNFVNFGGVEYDLGDFGPGDWANYTGNYPAGEFDIYMRTAGLGSYSMYLEQVVSGAGTTNQTVKKLGDWNSVGINNATYAWVPLTEDGTGAPVAVSLGGVETLRLTTPTGFCYPNYFMLVPTTGISPSIAKLGANVVVSFPGEPGVTYGVYSRSNLSTGNWNLLTNVVVSPINGVAAVSIAVTNTEEFYKVGPP